MGYRVSLSANYPPMAVPLKLDITTGDRITPKEIEYRFKLLLEDRSISVLVYNNGREIGNGNIQRRSEHKAKGLL